MSPDGRGQTGDGRGRVRVDPAAGWVARGLVEVPSVPIHLDGCLAERVGPAGWYLNRPGFAWGAMGVACWLGGAIGIGRTLHVDPGAGTGSDSAHASWRCHAALTAASQLLVAAADAVDRGRADGEAGAVWAARVRAVVAGTVDTVLLRVGHALGPGPLAADCGHARRVADLQLHVRQHHAERDDAALGALVCQQRDWP